MEIVDVLPLEKHYNLTHHQQRYHWDCGLSCILMILSQTQREYFLQNFAQICADEGFGFSVWTIDLCYLLKALQVQHIYYTKYLGVDQNYRLHHYYAKVIDKDQARVERKFQLAAANGIQVQQRILSMHALIEHLSSNGPIILLTNAAMLKCNYCKKDILQKFGYAGHYVTLCGYNLKQQQIYYRNPEVNDGHICHCSIDAMETARKAYGTDEDVVFIFQAQN